MQVLTYEDVRERVAGGILRVRVTRTDADVPLQQYLAENGSRVSSLARQLVKQFHHWCNAGVHNPGLCVDACVVNGGSLEVTDWTCTELCDGNGECCQNANLALQNTVTDMFSMTSDPAWDVRLPEHTRFTSAFAPKPMPLSLFSLCKFVGLNAHGRAFVGATCTSKQDVELQGAAVLLAHKLYGRSSDKDVTPVCVFYALNRAVSVDALVSREWKLFQSFVSA